MLSLKSKQINIQSNYITISIKKNEIHMLNKRKGWKI